MKDFFNYGDPNHLFETAELKKEIKKKIKLKAKEHNKEEKGPISAYEMVYLNNNYLKIKEL